MISTMNTFTSSKKTLSPTPRQPALGQHARSHLLRDSLLASTGRLISALERQNRRSDEKDVKIVIDVLQKAKVLVVIENRAHRMQVRNELSTDPLHKLKERNDTMD